MTFRNCEIVDSGAFCGGIFFSISPKNLLGDFFDSLASAPGAHVDIDVVRNYARDEGRPLGAGLQEQASNHLKVLWLRAGVLSVKEKSGQRILAGRDQGDERKQTSDEVSKLLR